MAYRVIQWATGNVGRAAVEGILAHPELELAGCWVYGAENEGRDVGEICGLGASTLPSGDRAGDGYLDLALVAGRAAAELRARAGTP
jgi:hypothetical protein